MIFLRPYIFLNLTRKTGEVKNVLQNISKSSKLSACFSVNSFKNEDEKCSLENVTLNNVGYVERLKNEALMSDNKNENNNITTEHSELVQSDNNEVVYNLNDALEEEYKKLPGPFDRCNEDLSDIGPNITPTYNFAKFANESHTLQQLIKLGVELYKLESDPEVLEMFLSLDFDKHMKPYIQFLHDCGVDSENLGKFITRNPKIFKEEMDDLYTRIRYLRAHNFDTEMIKKIVNSHPPWLSFPTKEIDRRLGYFQNIFKLSGSEVRYLATNCAKLITYNMKNIRNSTFAVKEEMGFDKDETKVILLKAPRVWIRAKRLVVDTFDYLHNCMKLSHTTICLEPMILTCRRSRLERRHKFLVSLSRDQFNPSEPLYVSPLTLVRGSDLDFCNEIAKTSVDTYNQFLKTL